jgi:hypothetical protein
MPAGQYKVEVIAPNFKTARLNARYEPGRTGRYDFRLAVGTASETVEVTAAAPMIETSQSQITNTFSGTNLSTNAGVGSGYSGKKDRDRKKQEMFADNQASANVLDLQKRVAGVLPVRIDVPRAGNSYRFERALVLDEETKVTFTYKTTAKK